MRRCQGGGGGDRLHAVNHRLSPSKSETVRKDAVPGADVENGGAFRNEIRYPGNRRYRIG